MVTINSENFVYWLRGFLEISGSKELTATQVQIIQDHLALVMEKETPVRDSSPGVRHWNTRTLIC